MEVKCPSPFASVLFCLSYKRAGPPTGKSGTRLHREVPSPFPSVLDVLLLQISRSESGSPEKRVCLRKLRRRLSVSFGLWWGSLRGFRFPLLEAVGGPCALLVRSVGAPLIVLICGWRASRRAWLSAGSGCLPRSSAQSQEPCDWIL